MIQVPIELLMILIVFLGPLDLSCTVIMDVFYFYIPFIRMLY